AAKVAIRVFTEIGTSQSELNLLRLIAVPCALNRGLTRSISLRRGAGDLSQRPILEHISRLLSNASEKSSVREEIKVMIWPVRRASSTDPEQLGRSPSSEECEVGKTL